MLHRFLFLMGLGVVCLLGAGAGGAASTISDPSGDSGDAPDLTSISVRDYADGVLRITVTATRFAAVQPDHAVWLMLNSDMNTATGSGAGRGADYAVGSTNDWLTYGAAVYKWNGTTWAAAPEAATHLLDESGDVLTFTLNTKELNIANAFTLQVQSVMAGVTGVADYGPDSGSWTYELAKEPVPVKPAIGAAKPVPIRPVAGKRFTVTFPVTAVDTGEPLTEATLTCDPAVNGRVLSHAESFADGKARLSLLVPRALKGKQLVVKVTVTAGNASAGRTATYRIR